MFILVHFLTQDRSRLLGVNPGSRKPQNVFGAGVQPTARETFPGREHRAGQGLRKQTREPSTSVPRTMIRVYVSRGPGWRWHL